MATAQQHLSLAHTEREYYNTQIKVANESLSVVEPGERPQMSHYSYDFAQQVHFPFSAQQTGPEYFKAARKCGIFGICNDGENKQVSYLIDEAENPGKGADCVISLLHHYFEHHAAGEKNVYLHADNCVGQNKNNASIQYLMWRVLTGRHESVELSFMLVGHTKFSPDRFFGLFKKAFRQSTVCTIFDITRTVSRSTTNGQHVPQLIRNVSGDVQVRFYQWSIHLSQFFKSIPNILSYHNFSVNKSLLDYVCLRKNSGSEQTLVKILKENVDLTALKGLPQLTPILGLDIQRQWYLYENIRQHCKSTLAADITCPKPTQPKKPTRSLEESTATSIEATDEPPKKKRVVTCSVCNQIGHTKRTCSNKQ